MTEDLLSWRFLSLLITGKPNNIRKDKIPRKHAEAIRELISFINYWKYKYNL